LHLFRPCRLFACFGIVALLACARPLGEAEESRHSLFRVNGGSATVYLAGSVHLLRESDYPLHPVFDEAFRDADALAFEVAFESFDSPETQALVSREAVLPGGTALGDAVSPETLALVRAALENLGIDPSSFDHLQPWFVALTITVRTLEGKGFSPDHGLDRHFHERAVDAGKPRMALETVEDQILRFSALPLDLQDQWLLQSLEDIDRLDRMMERTTAAWKTGNMKGLEEQLLMSFERHPELYESLLAGRNRNWTPQIEAMLEADRTVLVVVGAAHLLGGEGLVTLLREAGYEVRQL